MSQRYVLVLAGGRGERFWPWSTPARPKQLLPLAKGGRTLLAATLDRALAVAPADHILILTAADLVDAVRRDCGSLGVQIVGEPMMRNTAAAIGAAAAWFSARDPQAVFAVLPADHAIDDQAAFTADLSRAMDVASREPALLTFGIRPTGPDTNFGYIRVGDSVGEKLSRVAQFTEKPDLERAREWVATGRYFWNSGIFAWRAGVFLDALHASRPGLAGPLRSLARPFSEAEFSRGLADVFPGLESISVDYAVLEHASNVLMIEALFDWDDLGSWGAWARRQPRDARGNVTHGQALAVECDGCVVVGDGGLAAALGLSDMVVVHVNGSTLTCRIADSDQVRKVSEAVRKLG
jgi:mannose-1-phosphate guanylyltransferase